MKLKDYLDSNGIKYHVFAEKIDVAPKTLWSILNKKNDMKLSTAIKIEIATNGQVTCHDLAKEINTSDYKDK